MAKVSTRNISAQNVSDILTTAYISYWADRALIWKDGSMTLRDGQDEGATYTIQPADVKEAVVVLAEAGYAEVVAAFEDWTREDGIDLTDCDAAICDLIVQQAALGELVYG